MKKFFHTEVNAGDGIAIFSLALFVLSFIILFFTGCMTEKKAVNKVINSGKLPELCAKFYPADVVYKPGDTIIRTEMVYIPGKSSITVKNDTIFNYRTDTITRHVLTFVHDTIKIELTSKIEAIRADWASCNKQLQIMAQQIVNEKADKERVVGKLTTAYFIIAGLVAMFGVGIFLRIKGIL